MSSVKFRRGTHSTDLWNNQSRNPSKTRSQPSSSQLNLDIASLRWVSRSRIKHEKDDWLTCFRSEHGTRNKRDEHEIKAEDNCGQNRDLPEQVEPRATHHLHNFSKEEEEAKLNTEDRSWDQEMEGCMHLQLPGKKVHLYLSCQKCYQLRFSSK